MKHTWKAAAAGALAVLFVSPQANAQLAVAKVVATCGTVSPTPHVGANYPLTIDITGTLCSVGGGGGGGGGTSSNFGAAFPGAGTAAGFEYLTVPPTLATGQMVAGQTDVNGNLKVTVVAGGGSNASVGTTAAAVPGSATYAGMNVSGNLVGITGTANGLTVAQATAANFNATVAQPTAANLNATVVQSTASSLQATVSPVLAATWGILAQNATTSGQLAQLMMGAVTTSAPTYTTGQSSPLSLDTSGALRVNVTTGGAGSTTITSPLGPSTTPSAAVSITDTGTKTSAAPALGAGGQGLTGWASQMDQDLQAGFDTGTQSSRVSSISPYPITAVPITASATGTTAATTATLTNVTGHTTYICGYSVRANATAATTVLDTVTGVITATLSSELWVAPNTGGIGVDEQIFSPCIPASAVSTSIAVVSGAPGTGGLVSVKAWGFSL